MTNTLTRAAKLVPLLAIGAMFATTALAQAHNLKILITTGFPDSIIESEGVPDLACAILKKPYSDEEVLDAVARCLA